MKHESITKVSSEFELSFHPEHLEDLRKSGLSDETIKVSGIKSVCPGDINKVFGYETYAKSMYKIPYPETDYARYKMFYREADRINPRTGEERPKYLAIKDTGNRLYIPHKVVEMLKDLSIPLFITEGEKKALKAVQEGLTCIAISGLWNWSDGNKELLPGFDQIALDGRAVYIVPDNDFRLPNRKGERKNLQQAVEELGYRLIDKGARVSWVEMPADEGVIL